MSNIRIFMIEKFYYFFGRFIVKKASIHLMKKRNNGLCKKNYKKVTYNIITKLGTNLYTVIHIKL